MVKLTVQIPDDVAARLAPIHQRLPEVLRQIAQSVPTDRPVKETVLPTTTFPVYNELLDFLITSPSSQDIVDFKVSKVTQTRLHELLEKNREDLLTDEEQAELDAFEQVEHVITLLKAKAHRHVKQQDTE